MSQQDRKGFSHLDNNDGNKNRTGGLFQIILVSLLVGFLGGLYTGYKLTSDLLKSQQIANNSTPIPSSLPSSSTTPSPTSSSLSSPTPSPTISSVQPTVTPTGNLNSSPTPSTSPSSPSSSSTISKNSELPGYFPSQGFKAPPSDLSRFQKASLLIESMVISGQDYIRFMQGKLLVGSQLYSPVFRLSGNTNEQRVGFELDGSQKALLLQFGLQDLTAGDSNLTYLVRLSFDGKLLWAGECRYGKNQQIISVPVDVPGAKSMVIEYAVTERGGFNYYSLPPLYFTKAELLY